MPKGEKRARRRGKRRLTRAAAAATPVEVLADNPQPDAIVIGTGFGGAVAACRLTQAGFKVLVLERGRRYGTGGVPFPRDFSLVATGWLWEQDRGLLDIRLQDRVATIQAAGYGGGSLIYANVHIQPPESVFDRGWPSSYKLPNLAPYFNLVAYMLNLAPITASPTRLPPKTVRMEEAAFKLGRADQFFFPNLAVNFGQGNPFQRGIGAPNKCNYCGECVIGCTEQAKNTLDSNYLKIAELGKDTEVRLQCEVTSINRTEQNSYVVNYLNLATNKLECAESPHVFLCAGALNSTELLLRCRDEFRTLPKLNPHLGCGYSSNADFVGFAFDTEQRVEPSNGPTITSAVIYDNPVGNESIWFLLEDGGFPPQIASWVQRLNPHRMGNKVTRSLSQTSTLFKTLRALAPGPLGPPGANLSKPPLTDQQAHSAVFLAMGRDRANGVIRWGPKAPRAWVDWNVRSNLPLYDVEQLLTTDFAEDESAYHGTAAFSPLWKRLRLPVAVHNLGGCPMSEHEGNGVVDPYGEVWGYPGLHVLDGAILPAATGVNPSHTIAAVAERNIENAIRKISGKAWEAPQKAAAQQNPVPEPMRNALPRNHTAPPVTDAITIEFEETLSGKVTLANNTQGSADLSVKIHTSLLDEFMLDKEHTCKMEGVFRAAGLTTVDGATFGDGTFKLFVASTNSDFYARQMVYQFTFADSNRNQYTFDGVKDIKDHRLDETPADMPGYFLYLFDIWRSLTTLTFQLTDASGAYAGDGELQISPGGILDQLKTFEVRAAKGRLGQTWHLARFARLFFGTLYDVYVRDRAPRGFSRSGRPR